MFVDGQKSDLINDKKPWLAVTLEARQEGGVGHGGCELVDEIDGGGKQDLVSLLTGPVAEGQGQMAFADATGADEDDVLLALDEVEIEQAEHLALVDLFREELPSVCLES